MREILFSSESVAEGHPDKVADQISDAVLDAILAQDRTGRVACEVMASAGAVVLAGEISTNACVDYDRIARNTIREIGYGGEWGFDADRIPVLVAIVRQSPDIALGVNKALALEQGAGDQGIMFGYACRETPTFMPAAIYYAHRLMERRSLLRQDGRLSWMGPDAKCQVSMRYVEGKPLAVETVVFSTQHRPEISLDQVREAVVEEIIKKVIPQELFLPKIQYLVNPTGRFILGGPAADCGLTGRKIIVDSYGGSAPHGGGAFSGKDPSKVDRSANYAARWVAKNIVASGLADKCLVQVAYAIGVAEPVSLMVETYGTARVEEEDIESAVRRQFDLRPGAISEELDLLRPIYAKTAVFGHFGRDEPEFTWESVDKSRFLQEHFSV